MGTSTKNGKTLSPKTSTGISTNGKKKPGKANNGVDYRDRTGHGAQTMKMMMMFHSF
jgi:hypothetical protein